MGVPHIASCTYSPSVDIPDVCEKCGKVLIEHQFESPADQVAAFSARAVRSLNEIVPGLYLGGYLAAGNLAMLQANGVSAVLTACFALQALDEKGWTAILAVRKHLGADNWAQYDLGDVKEQAILGPCVEAARLVAKWLSAGKKVLVHCHLGMSRSASLVIAYLMLYRGMTFGGALELLQDERSIVLPNPGFQKQLEELGRLKKVPRPLLRFLVRRKDALKMARDRPVLKTEPIVKAMF